MMAPPRAFAMLQSQSNNRHSTLPFQVDDDGKTINARNKPYVFNGVYQHTSQDANMSRQACATILDPMIEDFSAGFDVCLVVFGPSSCIRVDYLFGQSPRHEESGLIQNVADTLIKNDAPLKGGRKGSFSRETVTMSAWGTQDEVVVDLLDVTATEPHVILDLDRGNVVEGLTDMSITSGNTCEQVLTKVRSTIHTVCAESKSQQMGMSIVLKRVRRNNEWNTFTFVLAPGSEDLIRLQSNQNKGLYAFVNCMQVLGEDGTKGAGRADFNASKFTQLTQRCIGGNTKTDLLLILHDSDDEASTRCLEFAQVFTSVPSIAVPCTREVRCLEARYLSLIVACEKKSGSNGVSEDDNEANNDHDHHFAYSQTLLDLKIENVRLKDEAESARLSQENRILSLEKQLQHQHTANFDDPNGDLGDLQNELQALRRSHAKLLTQLQSMQHQKQSFGGQNQLSGNVVQALRDQHIAEIQELQRQLQAATNALTQKKLKSNASDESKSNKFHLELLLSENTRLLSSFKQELAEQRSQIHSVLGKFRQSLQQTHAETEMVSPLRRYIDVMLNSLMVTYNQREQQLTTTIELAQVCYDDVVSRFNALHMAYMSSLGQLNQAEITPISLSQIATEDLSDFRSRIQKFPMYSKHWLPETPRADDDDLMSLSSLQQRNLENIVDTYINTTQRSLETERATLLARCITAEETAKKLEAYISSSLIGYQKEVIQLRQRLQYGS